MWTYTGEDLKRRSEISRSIGYWLDYWLFLHGEETDSFWLARPLGIRSIARAIIEADRKFDHVLRRQLHHEVRAVFQAAKFLPVLPSPPSNWLPRPEEGWNRAWHRWLEDIATLDLDQLLHTFVAALAQAVHAEELSTISYLSRRLAAELGELAYSPRQLFQISKQLILSDESLSASKVSIAKCEEVFGTLIGRTTPYVYEVVLPVAPIRIPARLSQKRWADVVVGYWAG